MITYNHGPLAREAAQSILAQTFTDFELVIVDDGSTDDTAVALKSLDDDRIRYIWQHNRGPSEARNTALRAARGQIIAQMSGDDIAEPRRLEMQVLAHAENPNDVIFCNCTLIDWMGRPVVDRPSPWARTTLTTREGFLNCLYLRGNCFAAPTALAAKDVFDKAGEYKAHLLQTQDWDMWIRCLLMGHGAQIVPQPLLRYRISESNLSASRPESRVRTQMEVLHVLREYLSIATVEEAIAILPEIRHLPYPMDREWLPFLIAMVGLEHGSALTRYFAGTALLDWMSDQSRRSVTESALGFHAPDLFERLGSLDPYGAESLRKEIQDLSASRTWLIATRLRDVARFFLPEKPTNAD